MLTRSRTGINPSLILPPDAHIDRTHRVGGLLSGAWAPGQTARNLVRGVPSFIVAPANARGVYSAGHGLAATVTTAGARIGTGPVAQAPTYPLIGLYVGMFHSNIGTSDGVASMLGADGAGIPGSALRITGGSSTAVLGILRNEFSSTVLLGVNVPGGAALHVPLVIVWQSLSATNHRICVNGSAIVTDTTNAGALTAWSRPALGNANANNHSTAFFGYGFNRGIPLSDAEMQALSSDPRFVWSMVKRDQRRVWVPVGAVGGADEEIDEAFSAADAVVGARITSASVAESAAAAEAAAAAGAFAGTLSETASAAEAAASVLAAAAAVTGAASASESLLAAVLAAAAVTESASAADSQTSGAVQSDSVSEPTSASDSASAASIALGALSEAAALAETATAALIATSASSESLSLADLYAAAVIALAAVTEAAAASEQVSSEPVTLAELAESATLTDTLAVAAALVAQVAEVGSVADQAQAAAELAALLTEPAVAADLIAAAVPVTHDESVAELITALDAIAAALASEVIISVVWRYNVPAAAGAWRMDVAAADGGWRYDVPAASIGIAVP